MHVQQVNFRHATEPGRMGNQMIDGAQRAIGTIDGQQNFYGHGTS